MEELLYDQPNQEELVENYRVQVADLNRDVAIQARMIAMYLHSDNLCAEACCAEWDCGDASCLAYFRNLAIAALDKEDAE